MIPSRIGHIGIQHMALGAAWQDFKSIASANFATPAAGATVAGL
ncbi:MAG: hypothetical protein ACREJN_06775 [Nitrospiraceae bacterium]